MSPLLAAAAAGIHAAREPEDAADYLEGRSRDTLTVSLWGRVVECTRGWRASFAYPKMIYVPATRAPYWLRAQRAEAVALALTDYDVPVELLDADSSGPEEIVAELGAGGIRG